MEFADKEMDIINTIAMRVILDELEAEGVSGGKMLTSWAENLSSYQRRIDELFSIRCTEIVKEMTHVVKDVIENSKE